MNSEGEFFLGVCSWSAGSDLDCLCSERVLTWQRVRRMLASRSCIAGPLHVLCNSCVMLRLHV